MLPSMNEFIAAADDGRIPMHELKINNKTLLGFKYTTNTVYSEDWDNVSLHARGIVFEYETGKVLARPFDKFFNLGEMINVETGELKPIAGYVKQHLGFDNLSGDYKHQKFRVMDKLDGSLGIAFWTGVDWYVKTAGSFESDQAKWANDWFDMLVNPNVLDKSKTYLFEIIYNEDKHPIEYDFEGLVLLGIVDTKTGIEEPLSEILRVADELKIRHAEVIEMNDFDEVVEYAKKLPKGKEGVVITFENGFKLKVKGADFLALQRIFHYLSPAVIWENFDWENAESSYSIAAQYAEDFIKNIPEELTDMKEAANQIAEKFFMNMTEVFNYGQQLRADYPIRKEAYEALCKSSCKKELYAAVLLYYTNGKENSKIRKAIYRTVKP